MDLQAADRPSLNSGADGECGRFASCYVCLWKGSLAKAKVMRVFKGCWWKAGTSLVFDVCRGAWIEGGNELGLVHDLEIN